MKDLLFAARALARRPAFSGAAILTLALGIGANAAVFSVVNAILLRPLPYAEPERLAAVWPTRTISNAELVYLQEHAYSLARVAAFSPGWGVALTGSGEPRQLAAARTSTNFFSTLGVPPRLGRGFLDTEATPGTSDVVVLSHPLWVSQFAADPTVVGRAITLDGRPTTVIGVMPPGFEVFSPGVEAWLPLVIDPSSPFHRGQVSLAFGRLAPGATFEQASSELLAQATALQRLLDRPDDYARGVNVISLHDALVGGVRHTLLVLLGAVGFVVLIAAANVGNLLLVRTTERRRELAVRVALGASRLRVARALLIESVLLASAGGLAGLLAGLVGVRVLRSVLPADVPRLAEIGVDVRVLLLAGLATLGIGIAIGLVPASMAGRADPQAALRSGGAVGARGTAGRRTRAGLVVAELALAFVLAIAAGLMLRTLWSLGRVPAGFDPRHVLTMQLQPTGGGRREPSAVYFADVVRRVAALPEVESVGGAQHLPLTGFNWQGEVDIERTPVEPGVTRPSTVWRSVVGDYFTAMRIPLRAGRLFTDADVAAGPDGGVAIVSETFARRFWPGRSALGERFRAGNGTGRQWVTVVGIVGDVRSQRLDAEPGLEIYRPFAQQSTSFLHLVVRTRGDPLAAAGAVRKAIRDKDANVPISNVRTLERLTSLSVARPRVVMALLLVFAVIGVVLGAVGVYGVVSYSVAARTREIGVRMALGAGQSRVLQDVLADGGRLALAGIGIGALLALVATRAMRDLVYGVGVTDPATFIGLAVVLAAVSLVATAMPARRAARIAPMEALRDA